RHRYDARTGGSWLTPLFTSLWALGLGCGLPAEDDEPSHDDPPLEEQGKNEAALTRATSCDEVLSRIQASSIERLLVRADELRQPPSRYVGEPGIIVDTGPVVAPPPPASAPQGAPVEESVGSADLAGAVATGPGFSDTTAQVRG